VVAEEKPAESVAQPPPAEAKREASPTGETAELKAQAVELSRKLREIETRLAELESPPPDKATGDLAAEKVR
jgi:hypothetical protein